MIVVTSDHGDFLGDHWMGEKTFFQDSSTRVPLIVYDPSPEADSTRGTVCDDLVESIDLVPTFLAAAGGDPADADHILEGKSLIPTLHGTSNGPLRDYVICELDYSSTPMADKLGLGVRESIAFMVADRKWKLVHCEGGFRPMLFDLENDPGELEDLGGGNAHGDVIDAMYDKLFAWARRPSQRTTRSAAQLTEMRTKGRKRGVVIGVYDENDVPLELTRFYRNRKARDRRRPDGGAPA